MGTDIRAVWQARRDGRWIDVPSTWNQKRDYILFAWLADVHNGFGFAGVRTHEPIKAIAEPRGLPSDFEMIEGDHPLALDAITDWNRECLEKWPASYRLLDGRFLFDMGEHSHSWLLADEILQAERPMAMIRLGVITRAEFEAWDGRPDTLPKTFRFEHTPGQVTVDAQRPLPDDATQVRISWTEADYLQYFAAEVARMKAEHGEVRFVFGFDS